MITEEHCMKFILAACPEFSPYWKKHLSEWDGDVSGLSLDMSAFAEFASDRISQPSSGIEVRIFKAVEYLLIHGDEGVRNAVATSFLETKINKTSSGGISAPELVKLSLPESLRYCQAWDAFTGVKTPGL